jgi:hypothetical protein
MNPARRPREAGLRPSRPAAWPPALQDAGGQHVRIDGGFTSEELPHLIGWLTAV